MFEIAVLALSSAANFLLGLGVYLKNTRSITNRLFFMMTISFAAWSIVNYISLHPTLLSQLTWIRLVLFFAAFLCLSVFLTFEAFPHYSLGPATRKLRRLALIATAVVMPLTISPLVFKGLKYSGGNAQPVPNPGIALFALLVISLLGGGVWTLINKYRHSYGLEKLQIKLVLLGLAGTFGLILITDFLLVVAFHYTKLVPLGPAYTLIFSGSLGYAIVRHRLFDIRAAVARSMAYVLSSGTLALIFVVAIYGVVNGVFSGPERESLRQFATVVLMIPMVLSFQLIKRYFDNLTTKIFYRDAYDTQAVLDRLGDVIVAEINLEKIVAGTTAALESALKSSFVEFLLFEGHQATLKPGRQLGDEHQIQSLVSHIREQHRQLIDIDELGMDHPLRGLFVDLQISVSLRLRTQQKIVGYMIFGDKRGGDSYSEQDLKLLAIAADELAVAIQNAQHFQEISRFNITLQQKIEEATSELRQANSRLRELDKSKDEFISMASHQLRTPLTSVKGYLSMVLEGDVGPVTKDEKAYIKRAYDQAQKMVYLIADLLNVSRLQTGKFVIESHPTDLAEVVKSEIEQLEEQAAAKQIKLVYDKPKDFPMMNLDETKVRQVVMNFLDNALYYTPNGGTVTAKLEATSDSVSYSVTDTGIGVPKELQHRLFGKFYRADNARKMRPDGTGLGLFMAKKVVVAQGGDIIFHSTEGKGSTFGFSFPRAALEVKDAKAAKAAAKPAEVGFGAAPAAADHPKTEPATHTGVKPIEAKS